MVLKLKTMFDKFFFFNFIMGEGGGRVGRSSGGDHLFESGNPVREAVRIKCTESEGGRGGGIDRNTKGETGVSKLQNLNGVGIRNGDGRLSGFDLSPFGGERDARGSA